MLVLDGACADRNVGEQIVEITPVLRIEHLIGRREPRLLNRERVKLADCDDAGEQVRLLLGIGLVHQSL